MRILHTGDWHLGDRLGRIDRTDDLRQRVEEIAELCQSADIDTVLLAGDIFSDLARPETLQESLQHWSECFGDFLRGGGTLLTLTGNHDSDVFCRTIQRAFDLAVPATTEEPLQPGRVYLANDPTFIKLCDRRSKRPNAAVGFALFPYPTTSRYLPAEAQNYRDVQQKRQALRQALLHRLSQAKADWLDAGRPTVMGAHLAIEGALLGGLFRLSDQEEMVITPDELTAEQDSGLSWSYIALGHIHRPQLLGGHAHARYSGSIDRLDLGEKDDPKSVAVFSVDADNPRPVTQVEILPLDATPMYDVRLENPSGQSLERLAKKHPDRQRALVRLQINYTAGEHNLQETLAHLHQIFPRWYSRQWTEIRSPFTERPVTTGKTALTPRSSSEPESIGVAGTVRRYLSDRLSADDVDREALLQLADELLQEVP